MHLIHWEKNIETSTFNIDFTVDAFAFNTKYFMCENTFPYFTRGEKSLSNFAFDDKKVMVVTRNNVSKSWSILLFDKWR